MNRQPPASAFSSEMVRELNRPGNRVLGFCEYGDPNGIPVLAFHGIPGTRLMFRPADAIAARLGLRIIAPDRPGFGRSTPQPNRQLKDWLLEVKAVLSACGVERFALLGISGGSPFATAAAAHFGGSVTAMALFGPMGPVTEMGAGELAWLERNFFLRLAKMPGALYALTAPANALFHRAPNLAYGLFLNLLPECDRQVMCAPGLREQVILDVRESLAQGGEGMRADLRIYAQPWDVSYAAITAPTVLWQGLDDTIVPVAAALRLGDLIPGCTVQRLNRAGHFWIYDHIELVLKTLCDIAKAQSNPVDGQQL
ncbi:MAG: alpha/beta hydrolase [Pseudomonadota bacterium]